MTGVWESLPGAFQTLVTEVVKLGPTLSAPVMIIFCLALVIIMFRVTSPPIPPIKIEHGSVADTAATTAMLQKTISDLQKKIDDQNFEFEQRKRNPEYTQTERIYFNLIGIANSGLILTLSLLVFEYITFNAQFRGVVSNASSSGRPRPAPSIDAFRGAVEREIAALSATVGMALIVASIIVYMVQRPGGRSIEIINRSFKASLFVCAMFFLAFVLLISPKF